MQNASNSQCAEARIPAQTTTHVPVNQDQPRWSKETLWKFCDDFDAMDLRDIGSIRHSDFTWALKALGKNAAHKEMISEHFARTTEELSEDAFLHLAFPSATSDEHVQLRRWARQRKVWLLLTRHGFTAHDHELRRIFDLLREDKEVNHVNVESMVSAGILTQAEADAHILTPGYPHPLNFVRFRRIFRTTLELKFKWPKNCKPKCRKPTRGRQQTFTPQLQTRAMNFGDKSTPTAAFSRLDIFAQPPALAVPEKMPAEHISGRLTFRDALNLRRVKWGLSELP